MYKILWLLFVPSLLYGQARSSQELLDSGMKKYPIECGSITYEIGEEATGKETLLFDRYGWRSEKRMTMKFELYDASRTRQQHEITDGESIYRISHEDSTIQTRVDRRWSQELANRSSAQASESILFSLGGSYETDSTLLGRSCQVWTFSDSRSLEQLWVWNGLVLKRTTKLAGKRITTTATEVNLEATPSPSHFELPKGYKTIDP